VWAVVFGEGWILCTSLHLIICAWGHTSLLYIYHLLSIKDIYIQIDCQGVVSQTDAERLIGRIPTVSETDTYTFRKIDWLSRLSAKQIFRKIDWTPGKTEPKCVLAIDMAAGWLAGCRRPTRSQLPKNKPMHSPQPTIHPHTIDEREKKN
jgi:hypothetical protein